MRSRGRNSYDFVRFCAASAVLFSHHFALAGLSEPAVPGYGEDFGKLAVEVFFSLSGFLLSVSLNRSVDFAAFVSARFLRIFPNLIFAIAATSGFTLVWFHNYANAWSHTKYVLLNILMFAKGVRYDITGVFEQRPNSAVNGPLWSLPIELWLYAFLFLIAAFGGLRRSAFIIMFIAGFAALWLAAPDVGNIQIGPISFLQFCRLGSFFFSGALLAVWWPQIRTYAGPIGALALVSVFIVIKSSPPATLLLPIALAASVVGLGNSERMAWFSKGGDASYGMYIFAWPVQQLSQTLIESFWLSMLAAFAVTTALGYATWHGFESRTMKHRDDLATWLRHVARRTFSLLRVFTKTTKQP